MSGLSIKNASIGPCGLELPPGLSWEKWLEVGRALNEADRKIQWLIGDWWAYGEHEYGSRLEACKEIRWLPSPKTCANYGTVSRAFDLPRRYESLSFSHHATVAALDPPAADKLLKQADRKNWTRENLRDAVNAGNRSAEHHAGREVSTPPKAGGNGQADSDPFDDGAEYEDAEIPSGGEAPQGSDGIETGGHGSPQPPTPDELLKTERQRAIKTAEALMRCFDDLQEMTPREEHETAIGCCKRLMAIARLWK